MKKANRRSKQASPAASSSSPGSDDKRKQNYEERVRQLEQENKAFQVRYVFRFGFGFGFSVFVFFFFNILLLVWMSDFLIFKVVGCVLWCLFGCRECDRVLFLVL